MPAITVEDTLVLPRIPRPDPAASRVQSGHHRPPRALRDGHERETMRAGEDHEGGRLGVVPADQLAPRNHP
jgi:hypothetical protein